MIFLSANAQITEKYVISLPQYFLQSVTVLPEFLWFGCYKDNNKKIIVLGVAGQGPTSPEVCDGNEMWRWWVTSLRRGRRLSRGVSLARATLLAHILHQQEEQAALAPAYFPVWVTFALSPFSFPNTSVSSVLFCRASCPLPPPLTYFLSWGHLKTFLLSEFYEFLFEVFAGTGCQGPKQE